MTIYELLDILKSSSVNWYYDENGWIRTYLDSREFCPLTFAYYNLSNKFLQQGRFKHAGEHLGLNSDDIKAVSQAADTPNDEASRQLRQQLVEILQPDESESRKVSN